MNSNHKLCEGKDLSEYQFMLVPSSIDSLNNEYNISVHKDCEKCFYLDECIQDFRDKLIETLGIDEDDCDLIDKRNKN